MTLYAPKRSFTEQQGLGAFVGILLGVPATVVILVGLFHALMLWRVRSIRLLLLATAAVLPFVFSESFGDPWTTMIATGYGLLAIWVSVQGLRSLPRSTA